MNTELTSEYYSSPDSGLVGYWRFDEGAGQTAEDLSFFTNNAILGTSISPDASDPQWVQSNILILQAENENNQISISDHFSLSQNYPNPFNPSALIEFSSPEDVSNVKLSIYNTLGEKIAELVNTSLVAGKYQYQWNAKNVATGMYIYELRTDKFISVKKMILLR